MMRNGLELSAVASLIGDPARANMLQALMDGRALTAKELAWLAGVAPQTASGHLGQLTRGGLLEVAVQGRHRYFRLAGPEVAAAVESLLALAETRVPERRFRPRVREDLRQARTCYDHLAGRLGVAIHDALLEGGCLTVEPGGYGLSAAGEAVFAALGIAWDAAPKARRAALRPCLDWSERRPHLAGGLAAALLCRCVEAGWIERSRDSRAVTLTAGGRAALAAALPRFVCEAAAEAA